MRQLVWRVPAGRAAEAGRSVVGAAVTRCRDGGRCTAGWGGRAAPRVVGLGGEACAPPAVYGTEVTAGTEAGGLGFALLVRRPRTPTLSGSFSMGGIRYGRVMRAGTELYVGVYCSLLGTP